MLQACRRDLPFLLITCVLALLWSGWYLYCLTDKFTLPPDYTGDSLWYGMVFRTIIEHGSHYQTERLGAPFGLMLYDFPYFYWTQLGLSRLLAWVTQDPTTLFIGFLLVSSSVTAAASFVAFRYFGLKIGFALAAAVIYTNLPFHLLRMPGHVFLSAYYGIPLALLTAYAVTTGRHRIPLWVALAAAAICGGSGIYYAALAGAALLFVGIFDGGLGRLAWRRWLMVFGVLCLSLSANLLPNLVYWSEQGTNPGGFSRTARESELYGLHPLQLFLPQSEHIVKPWQDLSKRYAAEGMFGNESMTASLGLVATFGLLAAFGHLLAPGRFRLADKASRWLARMGLWLFLCAVSGGIGTFFAYTVSPYLRALNRWSLALGFIGLFVSLALLQASSQSRRPALLWASLVLVATLAVVDQTPYQSSDSDAAATKRVNFASDQAFVRQLESTLPKYANILILPYIAFPEAPPLHKEGVYAPLRLYYHSRNLRFSYGAMKARLPAAWIETLSELPPEHLILAAEKSGFAAIVLLRNAYLKQSPELEFNQRLGSPLALSETQEFVAYRLVPRGDQAIPLDIPPELGKGWHSWEMNDSQRWAWSKGNAVLRLFNFESVEKDLVLSFSLHSFSDRIVRIVFEGQEKARFDLMPQVMQNVRLTLHLPPGISQVQLLTDQPAQQPSEQDTRLLAFAIRNPVLSKSAPIDN